MSQDIRQLLSQLLGGEPPLGQIHFAEHQSQAPDLAFRVDFPRLEILLAGSLQDQFRGEGPSRLGAGDVLYVPANRWNDPQWQGPASTLSILFGKQQLGFSLLQWDGQQLHNLAKQHVARRGPRIGSFLLQTLNELGTQPQDQQTARLVVQSLLSHCCDLLGSQITTRSKSQALFEAVRGYIDSHYAAPLTRESVAQAFYVSPNYLSHLFQKMGAFGFNEYLNYTRLEHAKAFLKEYDLKIKEIATACGFADSNYFCRLFRKSTARSPSEYRRHYHSLKEEREG